MTEKIKNIFIPVLQRFWIAFELFQKNKLMNHAAAGAYGFLLSAAPVLLIISFFASRALVNSPELVVGMLEGISFLSGVINAGDFISDFLGSANSGWAGLISVIPLLWTARLCALSMQRGLGVIFPATRSNPIKTTVIPLALGILIILFIFIMLMGSTIAQYFYDSFGFAFMRWISSVDHFLPVFLSLMVLVFYRIIPARPPKWKYIIYGVLTCMIFFLIFSSLFSLLIGPDRYNLLYGALGRLFLLLVNVYFFFAFFLFGAQLIMVMGFSDALLFIQFRKQMSKVSLVFPWKKIFVSLPSPLKKYCGFFKEGEVIFSKGSQGQEVYYILSGKVGVYLEDKCLNRVALIEDNHFFGEMEFVVSEGRTASIKAETDLSVIILPRELFRDILKTDHDTDQKIILDLSERLRSINKQVVS